MAKVHSHSAANHLGTGNGLHIGPPLLPIFIYIHNEHWSLSLKYAHNLRVEYYNGDLQIIEVTIDRRVTARGKEAANLILRLYKFQVGVAQQRLTALLAVWEGANTQHP
jgi:hypothetical protein